MVFPVLRYGYQSWTVKKAEHRRIDAFELWCWRRVQDSLGLQGDQSSQSKRKVALNIGRTDADAEAETPVLLATSCEKLTHWKRL